MSLNMSSLLDLKAELLKKSEEVKKERLQKASTAKERRNVSKKVSVFNKKNVGVLERAQKDLEAKREEDDVISQSRKKLEAKSRLYEKMISGNKVTEHDGSTGFLVDFEQKSIRKMSDKREEEKIKREEKEKQEDEAALLETVHEPHDPTDQWVDYVDSFGRSRRCLREDLPRLEKMDKRLQGTSKSPDKTEPEPELMSAAKYREMIRQKWEEEERQNMTNPDGPLHYSNVQFSEIRTHGVGYYQFEKDHEAREQQLSGLKHLREQTKELREKKEAFKQKRKAILKARLTKVKQRKLVREGKETSALDDGSSSSSEEEHMIGPQFGEAYKGESGDSPEILTRDESLHNEAPVRDWDVGKKNDTFDEEKWLDERRNERVTEFAPPRFYYGNKSTKVNKKPQHKHESTVDFAPTKSYFENSGQSRTHVKPKSNVKPKDPMALLEHVVEASDENEAKTLRKSPNYGDAVEQNVMVGISEIRTKIENSVRAKIIDEGITQTSVLHNFSKTLVQASNGNYRHGRNEFAPNGSVQNELDISRELLLLPPPPPPNQRPEPTHVFMPDTNSHVSINHANHEVNISRELLLLPPPPPPDRSLTETQGFNQPVTHNFTLENNTCNEILPNLESAKLVSKPEISTGKVRFSSAPVKYDRFTAPITKPRYERVNLYEVPDTLPAPPTAGNVPNYPSQEDVFGSNEKKEKSEEELQRMWYKQFQGNKISSHYLKLGQTKKDSSNVIERVKPDNIPFVSPYVQKCDTAGESEKQLEFDPSKPPPDLKVNKS